MSVPPSEKIVLGFIGVAGRGFHTHMPWFGKHEDVEIGAVCDVYEAHLQRAVEFTEGRARGYKDYRDLLADQSIDAVVISTPPHWHALQALHALEAGKDVYCEKPMCRYAGEGKLMADAATRYKRVTQVGTQMHAADNYRRCVNVVRSGTLGYISAVRNFCSMNDRSEGLDNPPNEAPPAGLDWDSWLGPAPVAPFNMGRFRDGMHRYFKDYVDSWLHELGSHIVDLPFYALEPGFPLTICATGGRYETSSIADVPDTLDVVWQFPGMNMTWSLMQASSYNFGVGKPGEGRQLAVTFHGSERTLLANYGVCQVVDKAGNPVDGESYPEAVPLSPGHEREFLDCIRSREECSCSFEKHLPLHTALNLAHVALAVDRKLHWDALNWCITGDDEANALVWPTYREPYRLPGSPA